MKRLALLPLLLCLNAVPAFAEDNALVISDVVEAEYAACKGATAAFKKKVFNNVTKSCVGKSACRLVSSQAAEDLGCKKLYVKLTCNDDSEREFVRKAEGVMRFDCK